ncbi:hypothetical protein [Amycolatopsis sp. NPDC051128]|uniref:hypothetical protein n=1 Tax=Amycolatopsis sp. NPDC051128 TaxID=3155412 RepID=UPI003429BAAE
MGLGRGVFIGFAGQPVAVVRRELEDACEVWDCRLDEDTLDAFAAELAAGERVEIDAGTTRVPQGALAEADWREVPF